MAQSSGEYIHGTDPEEQRRLSLLNDLLNDASLEAMGIEGGERILDVGCGLGQLTRAMARAAAPDGHVIGIDRDGSQLEEATNKAEEDGEHDLVEFRQGDVTDFPLGDDEWGTFDIVHARFVLEHLTDPQSLVSEMVRAARPGGRIILEDDDHDVLRLWPEPTGAYDVWRAYVRAYEKIGNDPFVGRRLVAFLKTAGAEPVRNNWMFFGSCSGNPTFRAFVDNFVGVLVSARDTILEAGLLEPADFDQGIESLRAWGDRSDAALWYATHWAEGRRA